MNYIKEIKAFYDLVQVKQLSTGQIALWHALMQVNNKCAWIEWFTAPNLTLELTSGLSRKGIYKARNVLKQHGIIDFKSNGTKATSYKLISLLNNTQVSTRDSTQDNNTLQDSTQEGTQSSTQDSTQEGTQGSATLNKLNETKLNETNTTNNNYENPGLLSEEEIKGDKGKDDFTIVARLYKQCIGAPNGLTKDWLQGNLELYGLEWFKNALLIAEKNGKRTKSYVEAILRNWKNDGGMKLDSKKKPQQKKTGKPNNFHNFKQRTEKYSADELEDKIRKKFENKISGM